MGPDVFKAGRLKLFLDNWKEITSDETILDMVSGCHIDISENESVNEVKNMRPINFNEKEKEIVNNEVQKLLDKGVIEKTQKSEGDIISNIFIRLKKDKSYRVIINLKNLNKIIEYHHFKMESLMSAVKLMVPNCFMASVDLKDAYYSVPVATEHRKYLKFEWNGCLFQFSCLAMGLACSPRKFTKLLKPVYAELRKYGCLVVPYIDDSYIQGDTVEECWNNVKAIVNLLQSLGFILNIEKSVFQPTQEIQFLGFILNSVHMNVKLTKDKIEVLQNEIKCLVKKQQVQILQVSRVLGLMVASFPGVEYGPLFYRSLENRKIDALKISKGNFDSYMKLDQENLDDLNWWIQNIKGSCKNIKRDSPNVIVQTDASKKGWGRT